MRQLVLIYNHVPLLKLLTRYISYLLNCTIIITIKVLNVHILTILARSTIAITGTTTCIGAVRIADTRAIILARLTETWVYENCLTVGTDITEVT